MTLLPTLTPTRPHLGDHLARTLRVARIIKRRTLCCPRGGGRAGSGFTLTFLALSSLEFARTPSDLSLCVGLALVGLTAFTHGLSKLGPRTQVTA